MRRDPLGGYFDYTAAHRALPSQALTLVQLSREFGHPGEPPNPTGPAAPAEPPSPPADTRVAEALKRLPDWDADMVHRRRKPQ